MTGVQRVLFRSYSYRLTLQSCFQLDTLAQCISQFQLRTFPHPLATGGICLPYQSRGWGISKFCMAQGSGICLSRGQPWAFDTHMVSHPNIRKMEDFIGNTSGLADWLMYQGHKKLVEIFKSIFLDFMHAFLYCLSRQNLHCEIGSYRRMWIDFFFLLNQISFDLGFE